MKEKILLLHGWGGSDYPHWQSWLASEIAKDYGNVSFFRFSNYDFPDLAIWKKELKEHLEVFKPDIVVCHSLANTLWFHLCNDEALSEVKRLFLVAPPSMKCKIDELQSFFPLKIPKNYYAKEAILITSTDDPYLKTQEAEMLQKELNIENKILQNAGHINADSGYGEWQWILQKIKGDIL